MSNETLYTYKNFCALAAVLVTRWPFSELRARVGELFMGHPKLVQAIYDVQAQRV